MPLKCNFANKSALFPQAAPCPFSILGRTLQLKLTFDNNNDFQESVTCEITTTVPGVSLLFACVYRSPHSDRDNNDKILKLLKDIDNHPAKLKCITGDFNMPGIDWETGDTRDNFSNQFYHECSLDLFLKQQQEIYQDKLPVCWI